MILSIIALAALRSTGLPSDIYGIWGNLDGQVVAFLSSHESQARVGDYEYAIGNFDQVPDGSYLSTWRRDKNLLISHNVSADSYEALFDPGLESEGSEARLILGATDGNGHHKIIRFNLIDPHKTVKLGGSFYYLGQFDELDFSGIWSDDHYKLVFDSKQGSRYSGSLSYGGSTWKIVGDRSGIRIAFTLTGLSSGKEEGRGIVEWYPTDGRIQKITEGDPLATDQVYFSVTIPAMLPTGDKAVLKGKK